MGSGLRADNQTGAPSRSGLGPDSSHSIGRQSVTPPPGFRNSRT